MIDFNTKFAKDATNAYWQRKKSFKDKTQKARVTGLGAELTKAEKAWNAIPWAQLDFRTAKAASVKEAKANLARAKKVQAAQVRAAISALDAAAKKAKATGRNKALSDGARDTAQAMEITLNRSRVLLEKLKLDDLAGEIVRLEQAEKGRQSLREIIIRQQRGYVAGGKAGAIQSDQSVTVSGLEWEPSLGRAPKTYVGQAVTVNGTRLDGSLYSNNMVLIQLSSDGKKAKLK